MENLMDKRKVLFLFLPLLVLFVYDRIGDVVIFIIHKAFDLFAVSESFIDTSASFIDATTAVVLSVICYLFYRKVFPSKFTALAKYSLCHCHWIWCRRIGNHLVEFCRVCGK